MAVAILTISSKRVKHIRRTPAELRVRSADACVYQVDADSRSRPVVSVSSTQRPVTLIDSVETPRRISLRYIRSNYGVFLDKLDAKVLAEPFSICFRHLNGEAINRMLIDVF